MCPMELARKEKNSNRIVLNIEFLFDIFFYTIENESTFIYVENKEALIIFSNHMALNQSDESNSNE